MKINHLPGQLLILTVTLLASGPRTGFAADGPTLTFEKDIRPIFRAHCYDCHGATTEVKGGLDLRLVRLMQAGGESGPAIVPGKPGESYLLDRLHSGEMPPGQGKVSAAEIKVIEQWIAAGAPTARPEPESIAAGLGITAEERAFWSFQPIQPPQVKELSSYPAEKRVRTPVDALILEAMPEGLAFSPDADRSTLIKRAWLDLVGLPPTPEELERWLNAEPADWYDQLLTELLNSPHYGERWGRHWLDVAGYSDSDGYTTKDAVRPWAWKYRDWVIRSLNADKPFHEFLVEQLAGDELAGPIQGDLTAKQIELLTATGYLRMAADGTGSGNNSAEARNAVMADTLKIVGTSLLGLSIQCAQCHDHRYDPIPHTDYFALRAVFEPALDWQNWKVPAARQISLYTAADRQKAAELEAEAQKIAQERAAKQSEYMQQALDMELMKFEEPLREQLRSAYQTPGDKRTPEQKELLAKHPSVNISPGVLYQYLPKAAEDLKKFDEKINAVRAQKPVEEFLQALTEVPGRIPETKLFHRGDHQQPKQTIAPAGLTVIAPEGQPVTFPVKQEGLPTTGRRLAFGRHLTSGEHPLVARVIVNRVWMHHFGRGLVSTPADFGKLGARPTHPELLDWLAAEFVRDGWSLKKLHRLILTSTVWRQQSQIPADSTAASIDPTNSFYWRKPLIRLEAEILRDRMLATSGELDRTQFGPPLAVQEDETGQIIVSGTQKRRSLYIQARRSQPVAMMQAFDAPVMVTNCESRANSTVATQSLMLLNGEFILTQSAQMAERVLKEARPLPDGLPAVYSNLDTPWQYGFGSYHAESGRTGSFLPLKHWTGSQWQAGAALPDPSSGWVLLHAAGGHPDGPERAVIRRWTAPGDGIITINGDFGHHSESGDGVRGRIISSRTGLAGEWTVKNNSLKTPVAELPVQQGDTIDFLTDCLANQNADSFGWAVTIELKRDGQVVKTYASQPEFAGPPEELVGQAVRAWELAYQRSPAPEELPLIVSFLQQQVRHYQAHPAALPPGKTLARQVLTNLCQSLLSSNEFLYVD